MKKLFYVLLVVTITTLSMTSCTDEEVKPRTGENGGGSPIKEG